MFLLAQQDWCGLREKINHDERGKLLHGAPHNHVRVVVHRAWKFKKSCPKKGGNNGPKMQQKQLPAALD